MRIEDYALIGYLQTSVLVGRNGSVDWLCLPRFDSASCFTACRQAWTGSWTGAPDNPADKDRALHCPAQLLRQGLDLLPGRAREADEAITHVFPTPRRAPRG
jgi:hypothetical protein